MIWYNAITLKGIFWQGKSYLEGTKIRVTEEDARTLRNAGVIGDLRRLRIETAVKKAPENTKRTYKKRKT